MAFTTATVTRIEQGNKQFQGAYSEMWACTLVADAASIAAAAEDTGTYTIPGLALGDSVISCSLGVDITISAVVQAYVSAANTLTISIGNVHASTALDLATTTVKVLIGRPAW